MTLDQVISTTEIETKLKNLREHMPDADDFMCGVGEYFAEKLSGYGQVTPKGFAYGFILMVYDLSTGVDELTRELVPPSLTGHPPQVYADLFMYTPILAEKVCPEDFAQDVRQAYKKLSAPLFH